MKLLNNTEFHRAEIHEKLSIKSVIMGILQLAIDYDKWLQIYFRDVTYGLIANPSVELLPYFRRFYIHVSLLFNDVL